MYTYIHIHTHNAVPKGYNNNTNAVIIAYWLYMQCAQYMHVVYMAMHELTAADIFSKYFRC